jgi:hypothetical protein
MRLWPKLDAIVQDCLNNQLDTREAAKRIRELVPNKTTALRLFENYKRFTAVTPPQVSRDAQNLRQKEAKLKSDEAELVVWDRLRRARGVINKGLQLLTDAAQSGNKEALKWLVESAANAASFVLLAERLQPELAKALAKTEGFWPVLVGVKSGWEESVRQRITRLELGSAVPVLTQLREPRGHECRLPARQWARAAVDAIDQTRLRIFAIRELCRRFGDPDKLWRWCRRTGWDVSMREKWITDVIGLPDLSVKTLPVWKSVVRKLIREQMPAFQTCKIWRNHRTAARANGRESKGVVQNRILDDICDALERMLPVPGS